MGLGKRGTERTIVEELDVLVSELKASNGLSVDLMLPVHRAVTNVISSLVFGARLAEDPRFNELSQIISFSIARNVSFSSNPLRALLSK